MTKNEIINAFTKAHIALFHGGQALSLADKDEFARALRAAQDLPKAVRINLHTEIKAAVASCIGA